MIQTEDSWNTAGVLEIVGLVTLDNFKNGCDGGREGQSHFLRSFGSKNNSGYNEFGTIFLITLPPLIKSEKSNSENWSQSGYPPSLRK